MSVRSFGNPAASFRSRFGRTGTRAANEFSPPPPPVPVSATGGSTFTPGDGYTVHIFTTSSTPGFEVTSGSGEVEYLVIAGGGGGGADHGGVTMRARRAIPGPRLRRPDHR